MKHKSRIWATIGIAFGAIMGISYKSLPGGLMIAAGAALLLLTITNLETDPKIRN